MFYRKMLSFVAVLAVLFATTTATFATSSENPDQRQEECAYLDAAQYCNPHTG